MAGLTLEEKFKYVVTDENLCPNCAEFKRKLEDDPRTNTIIEALKVAIGNGNLDSIPDVLVAYPADFLEDLFRKYNPNCGRKFLPGIPMTRRNIVYCCRMKGKVAECFHLIENIIMEHGHALRYKSETYRDVFKEIELSQKFYQLCFHNPVFRKCFSEPHDRILSCAFLIADDKTNITDALLVCRDIRDFAVKLKIDLVPNYGIYGSIIMYATKFGENNFPKTPKGVSDLFEKYIPVHERINC